MSFATIFVTVIHVVLCVFMIFVILLQPGKDAGMGAAFGGGAATSAFGGRGAVTFLSKLTAACAIFFFITSLGLSFAGLHHSVISTAALPPATPPAAAADAGAQAPEGVAAPGGTQNTGVQPPEKKAAPGTPEESGPKNEQPEGE